MSTLIESFEKYVTRSEVGGGERTLKGLALSAEDSRGVTELVESTLAAGLNGLPEEDQAAWGALALWLYAQGGVEDAITRWGDEAADGLARGKRLWMRFGFAGVEHELKRYTKARGRALGTSASTEPGALTRDEEKARRTGLRIEVLPLISKSGVHRVTARAIGARRSEPIHCTLVSDDANATVALHDISGESAEENRVQLDVNAAEVELRFTVEAPPGTKVRLRLQVSPEEPLAKSLRLPGVFLPNDDA